MTKQKPLIKQPKQTLVFLILIGLMISTINLIDVGTNATNQYKKNKSKIFDELELNNISTSFYTLNCEYNDIKFNNEQFQGIDYTLVNIPDCILSSKPGEPLLPYDVKVIGIPSGAKISCSIVSKDTELVSGINILPCPKNIEPLSGVQIGADDNNYEYFKDDLIYSQDSFYPGPIVNITDKGFIRSQEIVRIKIYPLQYNPITKQLRIHKQVKLNITIIGGNSFRFKELEPFNNILKNTLENYEQIKKLPIKEALKSAPTSLVLPLSNENWYKITVDTCGIYELNYSYLSSAGIDVDNIDPRTFKIFNAGGGMLSESLGSSIPKKIEIPLFVSGEGDGSFDNSDSITFYGFSYSTWENYVWTKNYYEDKNVYWLTWGGSNGKRMQTKSLPPTGGATPSAFHKIIHLEEDLEIASLGELDYRDQVIWSFSEVGSAPWTNGVGLVKQAGERSWADYNITLTASRLAGSKGLMVMFRVLGPNQFYLLHMGEDTNTKLKLVKTTPGWLNRVLKAVDHSIVTNENYKINISVMGNNIKIFINDTLLIDHTDNSNPYLTGNIGLNVHYDTVIDFWNITVNGSNETNIPFLWQENFTSYPLRSNGNPTWSNLQGSLSDFTIRDKNGIRVYESTTENVRATFQLGSWNSTKPVKLRAWVKGMAAWNEGDKKHRGSFYINGHNILDNNWTGHTLWNAEMNIPNSILKSGINTVEFDLPGNDDDNWDYQALDWIEIDYWKEFSANDGYLDFNHSAVFDGSGKMEFEISNFSNSELQGFKIYDYSNIDRITNPSISLNGSTYSYKFTDTISSGESRYIIVESNHKLTPVGIQKFEHRGLNTSTNEFDYLIITHEGLYDKNDPNNPIARLANHRASTSSLNTTVITTQEIYDEFSNGLFDPTAIRNFLQFAYNKWVLKPTYVLFAGDTSSAFKIGQNRGTYNVPTHLEDYTGLINGVLASDNWLCFVSGNDHYPDLVPGRLPVASLEEMEVMVSKIITYDTLPNTDGWRRNAVFHADDTEEPWEAVFKWTCTTQIDEYLIPNGYIAIQEAYRDDDTKADCTNMIKQGVNDGCMMLQYSGHGSPNGWDSFAINNIGGLVNNDKYPFVMSMGCSTGTFDMPKSNSFCEEIILAADKGGIASWGPSRTATASIYQYFFQFSKNVFENGARCLGAECLDALVSWGDDYHLHIMTFFGDPAMDIGLPFMDINVTTEYKVYERSETINIFGVINNTTSFSGLVNLTLRDPNMELVSHNISKVKDGKFTDQLIIPNDAQYGTYRIFAYAWDAANHSDGLKYIDIEVSKPGPNLYIDNPMITFSPQMLVTNREINITAAVANWGTRPSDEFQVFFYLHDPLEGNLIGESTGSPIGRAENTRIFLKWTPADIYGDQEIYVVLDPNNLIHELNESDNRAYNTAHLLRPPVAKLGDDIISYRNITINFSAELSYSLESSIINYTWYFGDGEYSYCQLTNHSFTNLGEYNVTLKVVDSRNITDMAHLTVNIINREPVAQFEPSIESGYITTPFYFNSTSFDLDGSIVRHHWDFGDGITTDEQNPVHQFSSKGEFLVTLTVFDNNFGSNKSTKIINIGNLVPKASIEVSRLSAYTFENITFSGNGSYDPDDNNSELNFTWHFGLDEKDKSYSSFVSRAFQTSGRYNITLEARDPSGAADLINVEITILNRAPDLALEVYPNNGTINTKFKFSVITNDVDGYISNIYIDYGDGSILNKSFNSNPWMDVFQYQHQYSINKNVTVNSYVMDNDGSRSELKEINLVLRNLKPKIDTVPDLRTRVDQDLTITADAEDKDGEVIKYQWDYTGDGIFESVTTKPETVYKYTEPGNFTIILRAWDNDDAWSETKINVTVLPANGQDKDGDSDGADDGAFSQALIIGIVLVVIIILLILLFIFIRGKQRKTATEPYEDKAITSPDETAELVVGEEEEGLEESEAIGEQDIEE